MTDTSGGTAATEVREGGWYDRLTHGAPLAVLLAVGFLISYKLVPILELVAIAILIALVLRTVVNRLCGIGLKPWMSIVALFLAGTDLLPGLLCPMHRLPGPHLVLDVLSSGLENLPALADTSSIV